MEIVFLRSLLEYPAAKLLSLPDQASAGNRNIPFLCGDWGSGLIICMVHRSNGGGHFQSVAGELPKV